MTMLSDVYQERSCSGESQEDVSRDSRRLRRDGVEQRHEKERDGDCKTKTCNVSSENLVLMTSDLDDKLVLTSSETVLQELRRSKVLETELRDEEEEHRQARDRNWIKQTSVDSEVTSSRDQLCLRGTLYESRGELTEAREAQSKSLRLRCVISLLLDATYEGVEREGGSSA